VLALGKIFFDFLYTCYSLLKKFNIVLHPYYKLAYIKVAWGGPEEQAAEIEAGNLDAKDWQDEARKVVEKTVSLAPILPMLLY
jgi:hypothetical protein